MNFSLIRNQQRFACLTMIIFSALLTCLALLALSSIGLSELLPVNKSLFLSCFIGLCLGMLKHKSITHNALSHKRAFLIGMGLFIIILPFFDIGALFMIQNQFHGTESFHAKITEYFTLYVVILVYSFIFIGSWLSIISGFVFMALNKVINQSVFNKSIMTS